MASAASAGSSRDPSAATVSAREGPSMNSLTRKGWPPSNPASRIRAAQNGATRLAAVASAVKRSRDAESGAAIRLSRVTATGVPSGRRDRNIPAEFGSSRLVRDPAGQPVTADPPEIIGPQWRDEGHAAAPLILRGGRSVSYDTHFSVLGAYGSGEVTVASTCWKLCARPGHRGSGSQVGEDTDTTRYSPYPPCARQADVTEFPAGIGHKSRPAERYTRATRRITKEGVEYPDGN